MQRTLIPAPGAAAVHIHAESDVTSLTADLAAKATTAALTTHTGNTSNPHTVTKSQVGLGNVDNTSDVNKPISTAVQATLATVPAAGRYIITTSPTGTGTSAALGTGTLRVLPWLLGRTLTIDRIGAEVTATGDVGSKVRLGVFADNGNAYPGSVLLDGGQIAGDSATVQELTVSLTLSAGLYWIGGVVQSVTTTQPTLRTVATSWMPPHQVMLGVNTSLPAANQASYGYSMNSVTGALSTFTSTVSTTGVTPIRVFVRAA